MENPIKMDDLGVLLFLETSNSESATWKMMELEFSRGLRVAVLAL